MTTSKEQLKQTAEAESKRQRRKKEEAKEQMEAEKKRKDSRNARDRERRQQNKQPVPVLVQGLAPLEVVEYSNQNQNNCGFDAASTSNVLGFLTNAAMQGGGNHFTSYQCKRQQH